MIHMRAKTTKALPDSRCFRAESGTQRISEVLGEEHCLRIRGGRVLILPERKDFNTSELKSEISERPLPRVRPNLNLH